MAVESKFGNPDHQNVRIPRPGGKSLNPDSSDTLPTAQSPKSLFTFDAKGKVLDTLRGDPKNPDALTDMVTLYERAATIVGQLKTAARVMDNIVEGPKK